MRWLSVGVEKCLRLSMRFAGLKTLDGVEDVVVDGECNG